MTAATPMITPSIVSAERNRLPRIESSARRTVSPERHQRCRAGAAGGAPVVAGFCVSPGMPPRRLAIILDLLLDLDQARPSAAGAPARPPRGRP